MDSKVPAGGRRGHVPRHAFRTKASGSRRFYVEVSRLAWEKWGIFGFQVKPKRRFRMYMESLSIHIHIQTYQQMLSHSWIEKLLFKFKKNNTFCDFIDCFCLEILKASHLGIFNHQLDDPQPELNSG